MKFSIIIPVYNVEKYLEECLSSVLPLKEDIEILLINDGSTDNSGILCDEYAGRDKRIHVIHQKNGGLSAARNTGIRNSTGDYLLFLDSDDFFDTEETERLLESTKYKTDIIMGVYKEFYEIDKTFRKESCSQFLDNVGVLSTTDFLNIIPADGASCYLTAWRFVVKREFLIKNKLFFYEGIYHEDEEWVPRLLLKTDKICVTNCWFYNYRQARKDSIMSNVRPKHLFDSFLIMEHHKQLCTNLQPNSAEWIFLQNRIASLFLSNLINLSVVQGKEKKETINQLMSYQSECKSRLSGKKGKIIRILLNIFGVNKTAVLLGYVQKIRRCRRKKDFKF